MIRPLICNIKRIVAAVLLLSAISVESAAQVDAGFTQYMEVPSYYNPAAIGLTDYLRIRGGSRLQWMGIPKAPKTFLANADMPMKLFGKRIGVGIVMQQESMGLYNNLTLGAMGAYKLKIFKGELSIGARIGLLTNHSVARKSSSRMTMIITRVRMTPYPLLMCMALHLT